MYKRRKMLRNCEEWSLILENVGGLCDGLELMSESILFYNELVRKCVMQMYFGLEVVLWNN